MRFKYGLALALGLVLCYNSPLAADDVSAPKTPTSPVVTIWDDIGQQICTGFYIGKDEFVTAGHCFFEADNPVKYFIHTDTGGSILAYPAFAFNTNVGPFPDVAVLIAKAPVDDAWKPDVLNCGYTPKVGDKVSTLGYPVGNGSDTESTYSEGYVNGNLRLIAQYKGGWGSPVIPTTMPIYHGHSGSPVYHDGKVIGIAVGTVNVQPAWSFVQPVDMVCKILNYDG